VLSIITVTYNDLAGLQDTIDSVHRTTILGQWEHIVIDGNSNDGTIEYLQKIKLQKFIWHSENDSGIYDAMNKGIRCANGNMMVFLNAGDTIKGTLNIDDLKDFDLIYVTTGVQENPYCPKSFIAPFSMPYCHQGMIFPINNLYYDLQYRIASDLDFVYRSGRLKFNPKSIVKSCEINFDENGVSSKSFIKRDFESFKIIYKYSILNGVIFMLVRFFVLVGKILLSWK
jgi:glycosyltransferase involved in cell wall biosynthesis